MAAEQEPEDTTVSMEKVVALCKRRGFVFGSSELYGGLSGFWDYGPLGVELKNNVRRRWWYSMVQTRPDVVGLDSATLLPEAVWKASGHLDNFADPLAECQSCRRRFRADDIDPSAPCPECGGRLTPPRQFNTMFRTNVGPIEDEGSTAYFRPETAQGIFLNFKNVQQSTSQKVPFGIAQIGKSYRNEITSGNFIFRDREFDQMEMEFFVKPGTDDEWWAYWIKERYRWWTEELGIKSESLSIRNHLPSELSHYSKQTADIEYAYPFGVKELEGIADRTDYDLKAHMAGSGADLRYYDQEAEEHYVPWVIEPAAGLDRAVLVVLLDSYEQERLGPKPSDVRTVLRLRPRIAPVKVAVFPLSANKPELVGRARSIYESLLPWMPAAWDDIGNVGKRYRRQDEIGTPWCVTVDYQTLEDGTVTIRDRDSMEQERQPADDLRAIILERLGPV